MVDFKGAQFPKSVILHAVFFYVRYPFPIATFRKFWRNAVSLSIMRL